MRGNPDNLRAAAGRKRAAAIARAETALGDAARTSEPITFRGLARAAGVSVDFLYRSPLRAEIERLRDQRLRTPPAPREPEPTAPSQSSVVRALSAQLAELRRRQREEVSRLEAALAAAHGENLELRRRLGKAKGGLEASHAA